MSNKLFFGYIFIGTLFIAIIMGAIRGDLITYPVAKPDSSSYLKQNKVIELPCSPENRVVSDEAYMSLALDNIEDKIGRFSVAQATPDSVYARLSKIDAVKYSYIPAIADVCLQLHSMDWLDYFHKEAKNAIVKKQELNGYSSDYDKRQAELNEEIQILKRNLQNK